MRVGVDLAPLMVTAHTRLARISSLLRMLGASTAFVIDGGRLIGYVTRVTLFHVESQLIDGQSHKSFKGERAQLVKASPRPPAIVAPMPPPTEGA